MSYSMIKSNLNLIQLLAALLIFGVSASSNADEVVINDSSRAEQKLGDYQFSTFPLSSSPRCQLRTNSEMVNEITAGELWSYFNSQGLKSVDKLVICLDAEEVPRGQALGLDLFEVRFEDSPQPFTLGDNSLILTANGTDTLGPECHLVVKLDYDFMQKYAKDSKEKIQLNFGVNGKASLGLVPTFSAASQRPIFNLPNLILLSSFCAFWVVVFALLRKYTFREETAPQIAKPAS